MRHLAACLLVTALVGTITGCDSTSENAKSVTGPGIDVHCAAQTPGGNGSTSVRVTCPNTAP